MNVAKVVAAGAKKVAGKAAGKVKAANAPISKAVEGAKLPAQPKADAFIKKAAKAAK